MILQKLQKKKLISPPNFIPTNTHLLVLMGSVAYGCSSDTSDNDVYGVCIPPKHVVFPHLAGEIVGFGRNKNRFEQWQQHHIQDGDKEYDFSIYNIVKYFSLCMENNPNIIDSLFVPLNCVIHSTNIGQKIRENRQIFLHKGCWHKFKGYAFSQLAKMKTKTAEEGSKRDKYIKEYGYDIKHGYHLFRLMDEVEQLLTTGKLNLQRGREQMKSIRRGEWKEEEIIAYFKDKESDLEKAYEKSNLPHSPDENAIKMLLMECLEMHFGELGNNALVIPGAEKKALEKIHEITQRFM